MSFITPYHLTISPNDFSSFVAHRHASGTSCNLRPRYEVFAPHTPMHYRRPWPHAPGAELNGLWNCVRAPRQSIFRLESEIRHVTNIGEIRRCATLLNSGDFATLLSGTRPAMEESVEIHSCGLTLKIGLRKQSCCAAYIAGGNSKKIIRKRSGTVWWKNNGTGNDNHRFNRKSYPCNMRSHSAVSVLGNRVLGEALIPKEKPIIEP